MATKLKSDHPVMCRRNRTKLKNIKGKVQDKIFHKKSPKGLGYQFFLEVKECALCTEYSLLLTLSTVLSSK